MVFKFIKYGAIGAVGLALGGGLIFGRELGSYLSSSRRAVRAAVKENVPVEFELRRARDMIDDLAPEMQAGIRRVARQEVEIAGLRRESEQAKTNLLAERTQVQKLREALAKEDSTFVFTGIRYSREQVKDDLSRRFDLLKEAESVQAGKEKLLQSRERSLAAAAQMLERTRSQRALLEGQIAALESQHQLLQAASAGTGDETLDQGKLAQAQQLMARIKKDLDVTEQVLAHEARFAEPIKVDAVNEPDLLTRVDKHLADKTAGTQTTTELAVTPKP